ncbi:MAG TPA: AMP-dependent synthetase/ligase, partial [Acidimicrobiia bacterium]|nr:AMP-dependent synthetase/ligase [Acidimicrobiia bacterium]
LDRARREPDRPVAAHREGDSLVWTTAAEFAARVRALAKGLVASGVGPGDRVALMSQTRLEWPLVDYAVLMAGAATVPIYETSSAEQVSWIVSDSGAVLAVTETPAHQALCEHSGPAAHPVEVVVIDRGGLDELTRRGADVPDAIIDERLAGVNTGTLATIVYTSGTTGRPKGCVLTHGNLRVNVAQVEIAAEGMVGPDETTLLFLPLAHALSRIIWLFSVEHGIRTVFATDLAHLPEELALVRPTMVIAVPRVFEKVFNGARHEAATQHKTGIFDRAAGVAVGWSQARATGGIPLRLRVGHGLFDRLLYHKVREVFGGRMHLAFSGGGPLGERLTHFFAGVGIDVYEGYGLTESSPVLTFNRSGAWKPGTVGRAMPGTTLRITGDGEILARGPQVFGGYWQAPQATDEALDPEGWLRTGDIGELDDEGFLRITGRKKELIVTAAGKNVAPAPLEDRLRAHPLVSQALVVGDARPFVAALLALDEDGLKDWADERELAGTDLSALRESPEVRAALQDAVDSANESVSRAESIRRFAVLPRDLSVDAGELTPTLKVRRAIVEKEYADLVEQLYAGG